MMLRFMRRGLSRLPRVAGEMLRLRLVSRFELNGISVACVRSDSTNRQGVSIESGWQTATIEFPLSRQWMR
jgi:hypothetical protein